MKHLHYAHPLLEQIHEAELSDTSENKLRFCAHVLSELDSDIMYKGFKITCLANARLNEYWVKVFTINDDPTAFSAVADYDSYDGSQWDYIDFSDIKVAVKKTIEVYEFGAGIIRVQ